MGAGVGVGAGAETPFGFGFPREVSEVVWLFLSLLVEIGTGIRDSSFLLAVDIC